MPCNYLNRVLTVLKSEGISQPEFQHMVDHAAPVTHERGNRRYHHWLFRMDQEGVVTNMQKYELVELHLPAKQPLTAIEEHALCWGDGCKECGWIGEVKVVYSPIK